MNCLRTCCAVVLVGVTLTACQDNDELPSEPMRQMDSGLQMPNRDAASDANDNDANGNDGGDDDAGNHDAGQ